eukprot:m.647415 g.647415  ORF g.647415 m.647415 type:complete len:172 (-) comp22657_c0_seq1:109-624(-)
MSLPRHDSGQALERKRVYLVFETNEGDTPRILTSQFTAAWLSPNRGTVPVSWAIDPLLGKFFPELWNYYASSATFNDTFVAGIAGAGYVYLDSLGPHMHAYAHRAGVAMATSDVGVVDTGVAMAKWPATSREAVDTYVRTARNNSGMGHRPQAILCDGINSLYCNVYDLFE